MPGTMDKKRRDLQLSEKPLDRRHHRIENKAHPDPPGVLNARRTGKRFGKIVRPVSIIVNQFLFLRISFLRVTPQAILDQGFDGPTGGGKQPRRNLAPQENIVKKQHSFTEDAKDDSTLGARLNSCGKKDRANKANAAKSTGPKTAIGKRRVRLNALKHGLYSRELAISDADKPDFDSLRESLRDQLAPRTALQDLAFEKIVVCSWRCRLAVRHEVHQLNFHLKSNDETTSDETTPQRDSRETQWYAASPADLNNGLRLLKEFRDEVSQNGLIHPELWKDPMCKAFGQRFSDIIADWNPANLIAMQMAESLTAHAKIFNRPLEPPGQKVVVNPRQQQEMLIKLIDLQMQHLLDLKKNIAEGARQAAPIEFSPRYFATASRDLQRAVDWYLYLRSKGL